MAFEFYIDQSIGCVFIHHFGNFDPDEGLEAMAEVIEHPSYRKGMNILRDVSQTNFPKIVTENSYSTASRERARKFDTPLGTCRVAWVVGSSTDYAAIHRLVVTARQSQGLQRKPFRDIVEAREWLKIDEDYEINFTQPETAINQPANNGI